MDTWPGVLSCKNFTNNCIYDLKTFGILKYCIIGDTMAHYAFINENNIVVEVITGRNEDEVVDGISDWEAYYTTKREGLRAIRTSYNTRAGEHIFDGTPFRGNYAGEGYSYNEELDAFIPPKVYDSWVLDETCFCWVAPTPYPNDGGEYVWNEDTTSWDLLITES